MLSTTMIQKLNEQVTIEFESSNLYLQMAAWCSWKGFDGSASFLKAHSEEERMHMMKLFTYLGETGNLAVIDAMEKPKQEYESLLDIFERILVHERLVTSKINELVALAYEEKDYSSLHFLQWYVGEQHEEESLFSSILDKINLVAYDGRGIYLMDRDLGKLAAAPQA